MSIRIIQAELTRDVKLLGKMDPYALIKTGTQEFRTVTKKNEDKMPVWD